MEILITLFVGAIAGWLAGFLYKGEGFGVLGNIIIGILGSFFGYWLLGSLGIYLGNGAIGFIITAAIGAFVILFLINLIFKKRK